MACFLLFIACINSNSNSNGNGNGNGNGNVEQLSSRSLRGRSRQSETCEKRVRFGSADKPRVVPWAQAVMPNWTVFSRVAAAAFCHADS